MIKYNNSSAGSLGTTDSDGVCQLLTVAQTQSFAAALWPRNIRSHEREIILESKTDTNGG